jgi:outer membrane receptor protein involved in Fe transport
MQKTWLLSGVCAGALTLAAGTAAAQEAVKPPTPAVAANQTSANEVIVTAEKRRERLVDVPASVTALTGQSLSKQGIVSITDFAALAPGLTFKGAGDGETSLVIRGINAAVSLGPTVGVLVDGVPIGSTSSLGGGATWQFDAGTWDLNRVEVLEGPQSTLYGAAGMTGLVSYVHNEPALSHFEAAGEGDVSGTEDGGVNYATRGMVNIPIVADQLALRVAASHFENSGYIDDPSLNLSKINKFDEDSVRASLLWKPTSALSITLDGNYQNNDRAASDVVLYNRASGQPVNGPLQNAQGLLDPWRFKLGEGDLNIDYDLGPVTLTSVSSYQSYDGVINAFFTNTALGSALKGVGAVNTDVLLQPTTTKWTQELRVVSRDNSPLHYIAGFFYTSEDSLPEQTINGFGASGAPIALNPLLIIHEPDNYVEYAGYAQLGYTFFGKLDITGGIRYTRDTTSFFETTGGLLGPSVRQVPMTSSTEDEVNYLLTAKYKLSDSSNIYARASSGYRPGGPNSGVVGAPLTFSPDHLWNYEVGYKARLWNGRAEFDADAFYVTWDDIQVTAVTAQGLAYTTNGRKAISQGVEARGSVVPIDGLTVSGNVAYTDAHLLDPIPSVGGAAGERLPNSPTWSGAIIADYRFPLTGTLYGFAGGTLRAVGDETAAFNGAPKSIPQYHLPGYVLGDLRAGIDGGRWTVTAYIRNVGDSRAQLSASTNSETTTNFALVEIARPRTIGVTLDVRY